MRGALRAPRAHDAVPYQDAGRDARRDKRGDKKRWSRVPRGRQEPADERQRAEGHSGGLRPRSRRRDEKRSRSEEHERSLTYRDAPFVAVLYRKPEASRCEERVDESGRCERYARRGLHLSSLPRRAPRDLTTSRVLMTLYCEASGPRRSALGATCSGPVQNSDEALVGSVRAVVVRKPGPAENLKPTEVPRPSAGAERMVVRVEAVGVNTIDATRSPLAPHSARQHRSRRVLSPSHRDSAPRLDLLLIWAASPRGRGRRPLESVRLLT